jgi:Phospholipid methyltransferase
MVLGQFVLLGLIVGLPGRHDRTLPAAVMRACVAAAVTGVLVVLVGASALGRGLTAAPLPNEHAKLRTTGLYRHVRHPIYTELLLFAIAYSVRAGSGWVVRVAHLLPDGDQLRPQDGPRIYAVLAGLLASTPLRFRAVFALADTRFAAAAGTAFAGVWTREALVGADARARRLRGTALSARLTALAR